MVLWIATGAAWITTYLCYRECVRLRKLATRLENERRIAVLAQIAAECVLYPPFALITFDIFTVVTILAA